MTTVIKTHQLTKRYGSFTALAPLDLGESHPQKSERSQIIITNALHFGAFDKSDEAMLNDYEELMGLLRTGEAVALDFSDIVLSFLSRDPDSVRSTSAAPRFLSAGRNLDLIPVSPFARWMNMRMTRRI